MISLEILVAVVIFMPLSLKKKKLQMITNTSNKRQVHQMDYKDIMGPNCFALQVQQSKA